MEKRNLFIACKWPPGRQVPRGDPEAIWAGALSEVLTKRWRRFINFQEPVRLWGTGGGIWGQ